MSRLFGLFGFMLLLCTSCAERYSTRKRTPDTESVVVTKSQKKVKNKKTTQSEKATINRENRAEASKRETPRTTHTTPRTVTVTASEPTASVGEKTSSVDGKQKLVIDKALSFLGTPYRYGGTTHKGMDCSGLVGESFKTADISLHRSSHEMANQGKDVNVKNVQVGDLLFFITGKNSRISHVGIVVEAAQDVKFIHSSTSRGVIISSLSEGYWRKAYRKAKRVLM